MNAIQFLQHWSELHCPMTMEIVFGKDRVIVDNIDANYDTIAHEMVYTGTRTVGDGGVSIVTTVRFTEDNIDTVRIRPSSQHEVAIYLDKLA